MAVNCCSRRPYLTTPVSALFHLTVRYTYTLCAQTHTSSSPTHTPIFSYIQVYFLLFSSILFSSLLFSLSLLSYLCLYSLLLSSLNVYFKDIISLKSILNPASRDSQAIVECCCFAKQMATVRSDHMQNISPRPMLSFTLVNHITRQSTRISFNPAVYQYPTKVAGFLAAMW